MYLKKCLDKTHHVIYSILRNPTDLETRGKKIGADVGFAREHPSPYPT